MTTHPALPSRPGADKAGAEAARPNPTRETPCRSRSSASPDAMRGRVNSVEQVFVSGSNELGDFRAGLSAGLIGVVPAVVLGGVSTILVTALWAWLFSAL